MITATSYLMSKHDKIFRRILSKPVPANISWSELKGLLLSLGYEEVKKGKTGGSRRRFYHREKNALIMLHEPHPSSIVKKGCLSDVVAHLREHRFI